MLLVCSKCGSTASSKCPSQRTIFPTQESEKESNFWFGMSFGLKPAGEGWKEGVNRLNVTTIVLTDETEGEAMRRFIAKMRSIPIDEMDRYLCKHVYPHSEDCHICSVTLEKK